MKFGDAVIYVEKGVEYNAVVMRAFSLEERAGTSGEPVMSLGFFKAPFVAEYRYDVHHQSLNDTGAYWKEEEYLLADGEPLPDFITKPFDAAMADIRADARKQLDAAQKRIDELVAENEQLSEACRQIITETAPLLPSAEVKLPAGVSFQGTSPAPAQEPGAKNPESFGEQKAATAVNAGLPSAADLDAVEEEKRVAAITAKPAAPSKADAAQAKADTAQAKADTAQDAADDASKGNKAAAQEKADIAQDKADVAQDKADKAKPTV